MTFPSASSSIPVPPPHHHKALAPRVGVRSGRGREDPTEGPSTDHRPTQRTRDETERVTIPKRSI